IFLYRGIIRIHGKKLGIWSQIGSRQACKGVMRNIRSEKLHAPIFFKKRELVRRPTCDVEKFYGNAECFLCTLKERFIEGLIVYGVITKRNRIIPIVFDAGSAFVVVSPRASDILWHFEILSLWKLVNDIRTCFVYGVVYNLNYFDVSKWLVGAV